MRFGRRVVSLLKAVREPALIAFSTASSEAAYPRLTEQLEKFGVDKKVVGFTLPLGYAFNLDGSMMYQAFAALFIAQAFGVHMPLSEQVFMLLVLMLSSKGMASAARLGGRGRGGRADVPSAGGRRRDGSRDRPDPRHGAHDDERDRQQRGDGSDREVGGPASREVERRCIRRAGAECMMGTDSVNTRRKFGVVGGLAGQRRRILQDGEGDAGVFRR